MCINEDDNDVLFLALVDKGFNKPAAFSCLERIREDFKRFFTPQQINQAKSFSLNKEFQGTMQRAHVTHIITKSRKIMPVNL